MTLPMFTTAQFGPMAVECQTSQYNEVPYAIAFTAPIRLDDLVATLYRCAEFGLSDEELADLDHVRELVAGQIINAGLDEINEARSRLSKLQPGSEWYDWLPDIRAAVRKAFAPVLNPAPRSRSCAEAGRRELAGVA